jgi:hypothetical protein
MLVQSSFPRRKRRLWPTASVLGVEAHGGPPFISEGNWLGSLGNRHLDSFVTEPLSLSPNQPPSPNSYTSLMNFGHLCIVNGWQL